VKQIFILLLRLIFKVVNGAKTSAKDPKGIWGQ
jgi:hypothetical protein